MIENNIAKIGIIKYTMVKTHCTEEVFNLVDWLGIGGMYGENDGNLK